MTTKKQDGGGFSAEEKAAMKERAAEARAEKKKGTKAEKAAAAAQEVLDKIAAMADDDRAIAEKVHEIVTTAAPELAPKTWYGMPAYAGPDGKAVVFFQDAGKFKARYATLGFNDPAQLDDGAMWATTFAIRSVGAAEERQIAALVRRAVGR